MAHSDRQFDPVYWAETIYFNGVPTIRAEANDSLVRAGVSEKYISAFHDTAEFANPNHDPNTGRFIEALAENLEATEHLQKTVPPSQFATHPLVKKLASERSQMIGKLPEGVRRKFVQAAESQRKLDSIKRSSGGEIPAHRGAEAQELKSTVSKHANEARRMLDDFNGTSNSESKPYKWTSPAEKALEGWKKRDKGKENEISLPKIHSEVSKVMDTLWLREHGTGYY